MHTRLQKPLVSPWLDKSVLRKARVPQLTGLDLVHVNNKHIMHSAIEPDVGNITHRAVRWGCAHLRSACRSANLVQEFHAWVASPQKHAWLMVPPPFPSTPHRPLSASPQLLHFTQTPQWRDLSSVHLLRVMFFPPPPPHSSNRHPLPALCNFHLLCLVFPRACPSWQCCLLHWMLSGWQGEGRPRKHRETCLHSCQER